MKNESTDARLTDRKITYSAAGRGANALNMSNEPAGPVDAMVRNGSICRIAESKIGSRSPTKASGSMGTNKKTAHSVTRYPKAAIEASTRDQPAVFPLIFHTTTHSALPTKRAANITLPRGNWLRYVSMVPHFVVQRMAPHNSGAITIAQAASREQPIAIMS